MKPIDYRYRVSLPLRDTFDDGKIVCDIVIYGLTASDISVIPGGAKPFIQAVRNMGLDPNRYQCFMWDIASCESHNYQPPEARK